MKQFVLSVFSLVVALMLSGCAGTHGGGDSFGGEPQFRFASESVLSPTDVEPFHPFRRLVWRASLTVNVANVSDAVARVSDIANEFGGYVETKSDSRDVRANVTLRIPSQSLNAAIASLETVGKVTSRRISSEDVTDQFVDIESRLQTLVSLRDRLRALLDRAEAVQDVLAIETELSRVQGDIDSMEARMRALRGRGDLATITMTIKRKRILGPLGYVLKGAWWTVEKLFVIQG